MSIPESLEISLPEIACEVMSRVPPSRHIVEKIAEFLQSGISGEADVTGTLVRLGPSAWSRRCSRLMEFLRHMVKRGLGRALEHHH